MAELVSWRDPLSESNCYLLGEAGACVVIDPNDPEGPVERLKGLGWTPELVFLTHEHCDHMAGGDGHHLRRVQRQPSKHPDEYVCHDGVVPCVPREARRSLSPVHL